MNLIDKDILQEVNRLNSLEECRPYCKQTKKYDVIYNPHNNLYEIWDTEHLFLLHYAVRLDQANKLLFKIQNQTRRNSR